MGYRKAAMMRRSQYVRGHYRTSKNGNTYWVGGHSRNGSSSDLDWIVIIIALLALAFLIAQAL